MQKRYAKRSRASSKASHTPSEHMPGRAEAASWLLRLLDRESVPIDESFFEFVGWCCGGLKGFVTLVQEAAAGISRLPARVRSTVKELSGLKERRLAGHLEELVDDSEHLGSILLDHVREALEKCAAQKSKTAMAGLIQSFFGLGDEAMALCKYAFFVRNHDRIYRYFECHLDTDEYSNRHMVAWMLELSPGRCSELIRELAEIGILDEDGDLRLTGKIENAWKGENPARPGGGVLPGAGGRSAAARAVQYPCRSRFPCAQPF